MESVKLKASAGAIAATILSGLAILSGMAIMLSSCRPDRGTSKIPGKLTVWEDSLTLPTYLVNPPNPMPRFYEGESHQGVQRHMYPYPMNDNLTRGKADSNYHIVYMENEYIRIGIMPGLGGRIFEAVDKTNGYDFFYRQHVIKPSMIGMVGFWISGSLAWGYPHHHGPNTVETMDYHIEENPDGSQTIWMAYTEMRHRLRILFGYTVFPNSSRVEMTIRPNNPTPYVHSFLFWANPSVHCDTNYQVIFPPSVEYVTHHHKRVMTTWPVANSVYGAFDYTGKRIDLWKNTGVPSSFFAWDPQEDFFGGYDHGKAAGTAWIGNHHVCNGMKYWADGNNPAGVRINNGLTDEDGRYIELMAGAYTDNQPDYSWLQPGERKDVTMTWYPIRELGGMLEANQDLAMNLVPGDQNDVSLRINATRRIEGMTIAVYDGENEIFNEITSVDPATPFTGELEVRGAIDPRRLSVTCTDESGELLLSYKPVKPSGKPMPEALDPPVSPPEIETVEELFLTGSRLDQFFNAPMDPMPYYMEALKRDPGSYQVNTQLGILAIKDKKFALAEEYLQTAVDRITMRYTRPRDSDALYYLAMAKRRLGKFQEAYDLFYDATWNLGWHSAAHEQLAEMDCERGDYLQALDHAGRAISTNANNTRLLNLKTVILRKLGREDEAVKLAEEVSCMDPIDHQSRNELYLMASSGNHGGRAGQILAELERIMGGRTQSYLELASAYAVAGFNQEAIEVLSRAEQNGDTYPLIQYYLGFYHLQTGDEKAAGDYFVQAGKMPHTYCFPYRDETIEVLETAMAFNPGDAMAPYYLGNLFYQTWPEKAIGLWEKSNAIDGSFYIVQRNLGLAAQEQGDPGRAMEWYRKAFSGNPEDPRLMYEYNEVCELSRMDPEERYNNIYKGRRKISEKRSDCFLNEVELLIFLKRYDEAIKILTEVEFVVSEGDRSYRTLFQNALILRSYQYYLKGDLTMAVSDLRKALEFPIGRWGRERLAQMNYLMGTYLERSGDPMGAKEHFALASNEGVAGTEFLYDQGMALRRSGQAGLADKQFRALLERANRKEGSDFFRSFEHMERGITADAQKCYMRGLAYQGMGRIQDAKRQFRQALDYNPAHVWAAFYLNTYRL